MQAGDGVLYFVITIILYIAVVGVVIIVEFLEWLIKEVPSWLT